MKFFSCRIAIDLGTANTLIYVQGKGIVLNEPSMVALAIDKNSLGKQIIAVGYEAKRMLGKTSDKIEVIRPIKDGVIADFDIATQMIKHFIKKKSFTKLLMQKSLSIVVCVPCGSTQVERKAIKDAALAVGAKEVELIEEGMAAAIGAGLAISEPRASMVVDIGGGTTEVAVISLGGLVYANSIRVAGDHLDEAITNHIQNKHGLLIGNNMAEKIKKQIGSAHPETDCGEMEIRGRNIRSGLPNKILIDSSEVRRALQGAFEEIISAVKHALEVLPPELSADLINFGIVLTGGVALLRGLDLLLSQATQLKVTVAKEPQFSAIFGCSQFLK